MLVFLVGSPINSLVPNTIYKMYNSLAIVISMVAKEWATAICTDTCKKSSNIEIRTGLISVLSFIYRSVVLLLLSGLNLCRNSTCAV